MQNECSTSVFECYRGKEAGEFCSSDTQCVSLACVDGQCTRSFCTTNEDCNGHSCSAGQCQSSQHTIKLGGDSCSADQDCPFSLCCDEGACRRSALCHPIQWTWLYFAALCGQVLAALVGVLTCCHYVQKSKRRTADKAGDLSGNFGY